MKAEPVEEGRERVKKHKMGRKLKSQKVSRDLKAECSFATDDVWELNESILLREREEKAEQRGEKYACAATKYINTTKDMRRTFQSDSMIICQTKREGERESLKLRAGCVISEKNQKMTFKKSSH